jgi:hypothetical protein
MRAAIAVLAAAAIAAAVWSGGGSAGAATSAPAPSDPLPKGFFGVVPQAPPTEADLGLMEGTVETLRLPIYWSECEPAPGQYEFGAVDAEIGAAAAHGIGVMPFVYGRPAWLGVQNRPPLGDRAIAAWKRFLRVLVERYGSDGSFWIGRARRPIRRWQIWNEPNFSLFWGPRISPRGYAKLLAASAGAIRAADPKAKIVLAGIAPVGAGMKTWVFMRKLLRVPGVRADFDFAAIHPYSTTIPELDYQLVKVRHAMAVGGAGRKPLIVSEVGVASQGEYGSAFVLGATGQAEFVQIAYSRLLKMRRAWRIAGVDWFTWRDEAHGDPHCSFCQGAGLLDLGGRPKLAWVVFRRLVAHWRS